MVIMVIMPYMAEQISLQRHHPQQQQAGIVAAAVPETPTVRLSTVLCAININNNINNNIRCSITCPTPLRSSIHHHHRHDRHDRYTRRCKRQRHPQQQQEHPQRQRQKLTRTLHPRTHPPMRVPCHFACHTHPLLLLHHHCRRRRRQVLTVASTSLGASANAPFVSKSIASAFKTRHTVDSIANVPIARTFPIQIFHPGVHRQQRQRQQQLAVPVSR
jgi:hypothetical protein